MEEKKKKTLAIILGSVLVVASVFLVLILTGKINFNKKDTTVIDVPVENNNTTVHTDEEAEKLTMYRERYDANKAINSDYVGELTFESGLIDFPVVQGETNDTYLRLDWQTFEYDEEGSIFLDYRNTLDDQNLIIYGHYVYADETHKFSPLTKLTDKENYEANKKLVFVLEHEIRTYEVAVVYHCILVKDGDYYVTRDDMQYYQTGYTQEEFELYKKTIQENSFYYTDVDINYTDKFLTLQTCVRNRDDLRLIILCKQVSVETY